jgi:hypothetical protein
VGTGVNVRISFILVSVYSLHVFEFHKYEFRGFVYKGKLNAISQYDHYAIYPNLESMKEKIQAKIFELWQEVHPHIRVDSYVIDFAYPFSSFLFFFLLFFFLPSLTN